MARPGDRNRNYWQSLAANWEELGDSRPLWSAVQWPAGPLVFYRDQLGHGCPVTVVANSNSVVNKVCIWCKGKWAGDMSLRRNALPRLVLGYLPLLRAESDKRSVKVCWMQLMGVVADWGENKWCEMRPPPPVYPTVQLVPISSLQTNSSNLVIWKIQY